MDLKTSSTKPMVSDGVIAEDCPSHTGEEWLAILQEKSSILGRAIPWFDIKQDPYLNHKEIREKVGPYSVYENKLLVSRGGLDEQNHDVEKALESSTIPKKEKVRAVKKTSHKQATESKKCDVKVNSTDGNKAEALEATAKPSTEDVLIKHVPKDSVIGVDSSILSQTTISKILDPEKASKLVGLLEEVADEEMKAIGDLANLRMSAWREAPKVKKSINVVSFGTEEVYFLEGQLAVIPKPSASRRCKLAPDDILCMFTSSGILDGSYKFYFSYIRMCKKLETGGWEVTVDDLEGYVRLSSTMKEFQDTKSILSILGGSDPRRVIKRVMATKGKQVICEISNRNGEVIGYVYMQAIKPAILKDVCLTLYFCLFEMDFSESGSSSDFPLSTDCLIYRQQYSRDKGLQIVIQQTTSFSM